VVAAAATAAEAFAFVRRSCADVAQEATMPNRIITLFDKAAQQAARQCGRPHIFALAVAIVVLWGISGPLFGFSDTWQLVINTGTTIITFLMVFLIQNTQNRDTEALQVKVDELIRVTAQARNRLINLEDLTEEELDRVKRELVQIAIAERDDPESLAQQSG